jgi:hypothetical protein
MKRIAISLLFFILSTLSFKANAANIADSIRVFSRYNYYMQGQQASIVCVAPDSEDIHSYTLELLKNKKVLKTSVTKYNHKIIADLATDALTDTINLITYRVLKDQKIVVSGKVEMIKRPAKENAVQIDLLTGSLVIDNRPFFPFGFYCGPVGNLPETEVVHGFNMIGPYQDNLPKNYQTRKAYMDRCAQLGIRVQYGVNSLIGSGHNGSKGLDLTDAEKLDILKKEVIAFRDHPALLSWYINDEPDGQGRPPAILEDAYRLIHRLDPYHPISIVFMMPQKANDFRNTMDIAMTDPYPIPGPPDKVMDDLDKYVNAYRYQKSVWLVPQAFGAQEMWTREPAAQEIRLMTYMGLIRGAKGIQYYVHAPGNLNPQSVSAWSACSDVAVETAQMTSFLSSADDAPEFKSSDNKLLVRSFKYKGNLLIIVANRENKPKAFQINTDGKDTALKTTAELWFENREVSFSNGSIDDIIDAYGTRVYLIRPKNSSSRLATDHNLMLNPGFEKIVSPGLPIGSNVNARGNDKADKGATFFADGTQSKEGMFSLRLITPVDSGGKRIRFLPMVMSKGNSYTVSIWAKASAQENLPSFNLAVDGMQQTHTFKLTTDWKQYSFTYQAPSSLTTAILTLDLLQKGTAWFDLVDVSPDPVINYSIAPDHSANISVTESVADGVVRYAIDKAPDQGSPIYHGTINITKAGVFYASIFKDGKPLASSQEFIPVNKALGKKVKFINGYDEHYTAAGDGSLTDGIMGTTAFKDNKWIGYSGKDMNVIVDMETPTLVKSVTGSFLADANSGIFLPAVVEVYSSADGVNFTKEGEITNTKGTVRGEPYLQQYTVDVQPKTIRYIRIVSKAIGTIPDGYLFKGTTAWLFTDEILVQ